MGNKTETIADKIAKLAIERDRIGKGPLTTKERLSYLNSAYDSAVIHLLECVTMGFMKNTGALCYVIERTRLEMLDLARTSKFEDGLVSANCVGYEISDDEAALEKLFNADADA